MFNKLTDKELVNEVKKIEKKRGRMDFTRPLFDYLKEVIEREENIKIIEMQK